MEHLKDVLTFFQSYATLFGSIATIVIACYSHASHKVSKEMCKLSNEMHKTSQRSLALSESINDQNNIQRNKTNRLFWALIFANTLTIPEREKIGLVLF